MPVCDLFGRLAWACIGSGQRVAFAMAPGLGFGCFLQRLNIRAASWMSLYATPRLTPRSGGALGRGAQRTSLYQVFQDQDSTRLRPGNFRWVRYFSRSSARHRSWGCSNWASARRATWPYQNQVPAIRGRHRGQPTLVTAKYGCGRNRLRPQQMQCPYYWHCQLRRRYQRPLVRSIWGPQFARVGSTDQILLLKKCFPAKFLVEIQDYPPANSIGQRGTVSIFDT